MKKLLTYKMMVVCIISLFVVAGTVYSQNLNQEITAIEIKGNDQIDGSRIASEMEIGVGDTLDREQLRQDLEAIFNMGYFQEVKPSFQNHEGGLKVIIEVVENPTLKLELKGESVFPGNEIKEWMDLEFGQVINKNEISDKIMKALQNVEEKYQERGYIPPHEYGGGHRYVNFDDLNIDNEGVLTLTLDVGRFHDVKIKGNEKTKDFVILRELDFEEGEILTREEIRANLRRIYQLNYFDDVNTQMQRVDDNSNKIDLVLNLEERKTGNLNFGGGYSSRDGWIGFVNIQEKNLLGNGQTLGFRWDFGGATNLSLNFREPRLFNSKTSFGLNFYDRVSKREEDYREKRQGGSISLGHPLTETWDGSLRFKLENFQQDYDDESMDDVAGRTRSLILQGNQDTSNHPFNPTGGSVNTITLEYAGPILGGDQDFTKYSLETRRFFPGFEEEHAWAFRIKTGFGGGQIPELEKYHLGGSESLRGYKSYTFNGNDMLLMNLEYRFPIVENFTGVAFVDAGDVKDTFDGIELGQLHYSYGVGVRMNTPLGQIRLDYGWNDEGRGMPQFSIGQTF